MIMSEKLSVPETLTLIRVDLAAVKTDVVWLKRLFTAGIIAVGMLLGVDIGGLIG